MQHWKQITNAIILSYLASLGQPEEMLEPRAGKGLKTNKQEGGGEEEKLSLKEGLRLTWTAQITLGALRRAHLFQASARGFTRKLPPSLLFPIILGKGKLRS